MWLEKLIQELNSGTVCIFTASEEPWRLGKLDQRQKIRAAVFWIASFKHLCTEEAVKQKDSILCS